MGPHDIPSGRQGLTAPAGGEQQQQGCPWPATSGPAAATSPTRITTTTETKLSFSTVEKKEITSESSTVTTSSSETKVYTSAGAGDSASVPTGVQQPMEVLRDIVSSQVSPTPYDDEPVTQESYVPESDYDQTPVYEQESSAAATPVFVTESIGQQSSTEEEQYFTDIAPSPVAYFSDIAPSPVSSQSPNMKFEPEATTTEDEEGQEVEHLLRPSQLKGVQIKLPQTSDYTSHHYVKGGETNVTQSKIVQKSSASSNKSWIDESIEKTQSQKISSESSSSSFSSVASAEMSASEVKKSTEFKSATEIESTSEISSSSEMQKSFVSSSKVESKVFSSEQSSVISSEAEFAPMSPIAPAPILSPTEPESVQKPEEPIKPPKPPSHEAPKEVKKQKRRSVLELGKKLESSIIPMSPETVPGGIRMFPSPVTTPVNETPPPFSKSSSARSTPTQAMEEIEPPQLGKLESFPVLEPFPFKIEDAPKRERTSSLPPPKKPNKFVAGPAFTNSEYESESETVDFGMRFTPKKVIFQPTSNRSRSQDREIKKEAPPPWAFEPIPTFGGGMRPETVKKEEEKPIIEPKKTIAPKKNPKLVDKFLASAGAEAEQKITRQQETKQVNVSEIQNNTQSEISETQKLVNSLDGLFPQQPPTVGVSTQQVSSTSALSEAMQQSFSSVSFEKQEI